MLEEFTFSQTIDQTKLDAIATEEEYVAFLEEAAQYRFGSVAILPRWIKTAAEVLKGSKTHVCVGISYPYGANSSMLKAEEAAEAVRLGAEELDFMMNINALKSGNHDIVEQEAKQIVAIADGRITKAIIEIWSLRVPEIKNACEIAMAAGVSFIKTSTGYKGFPDIRPTTVKQAALLLDFAGGRINIKISGGVNNASTALNLIDMGVSRIGTSSGVKIINEYRQLNQLA